MPKVTFIQPGGDECVIEDAVGTLMEAALDHNVAGIDADCGGVCNCATCHVHIAPEWLDRVGPPNPSEKDLLQYSDDTTDSSRLSCQIQLTPALDGLVVHVVRS